MFGGYVSSCRGISQSDCVGPSCRWASGPKRSRCQAAKGFGPSGSRSACYKKDAMTCKSMPGCSFVNRGSYFNQRYRKTIAPSSFCKTKTAIDKATFKARTGPGLAAYRAWSAANKGMSRADKHAAWLAHKSVSAIGSIGGRRYRRY